MSSETRRILQPIIILPPGCMEQDSIEMLRENGICVVVAKDPEKVRFCDALAAVSSRTQIENAAIALSRRLLNGQHNWTKETTATFSAMYVDLLMKGSPLDIRELERERLFETVKENELVRLAKEEARAERAAAKARKQEEKK